MIYRIGLLFLITGVGHLFTIFGLRFIAGHGELATIASIGQIESVMQLLINIIGFGMQTEAIRTIAYAPDWKAKLGTFQAARTTFSLLLVPAAALVYFDWSYLCFLLSPILALSCEYALYARGLPIAGATIALIRIVAPLAMTMVAGFNGSSYLPEVYFVASFLIFMVTNIMISTRLQIPFWWRPSLDSIKIYLTTTHIGIISLCFYFFGLGILFLSQFLMTKEETAVAFMALKFYVIYRGVLRVISQGFLSQMKDDLVCLRLDQIAILIAIAVLGSATIYPTAFISLFFGDQFVEHRSLFVLVGGSSLAFGIFNSMTTRALLEKRDQEFMYLALKSVLVSIILLLTATRFSTNAEVIFISLLAGEIFFAAGLSRYFTSPGVKSRLQFLLVSLPALLIPLGTRLLYSDSALAYIASFIAMGGVLLLVNYRKFFQPLT